jgi:hypothetical protein
VELFKRHRFGVLTACILAIAISVAVAAGHTQEASKKWPALSTQSGEAKHFLGTWKLVSFMINGKIDPVRGDHPVGLNYYDSTGHMAVQIMPDRSRPKFAADKPTPDEAKSAITGYLGYFGTFTVDEKTHTVTHHCEGSLSPGWVGVDLVRRYEFSSNDRLILMPIDNPTIQLTWERIK